MKLYSYWRSGTSYRVRLAVAIKRASVPVIPVNLLEGEHREPTFMSINPQGLVPTLALDDGTLISQSPAIIEYLDETLPGPKLLPADPLERARARQWAALIGCDTHPLQNLRVLRYLSDTHDHDADERKAWAAHWINEGLRALEAQIPSSTKERPFLFGEAPGVVECYLLPQLYGARRYGVSLDPFPGLLAVEKATLAWPDVGHAHPDQQIDAL